MINHLLKEVKNKVAMETSKTTLKEHSPNPSRGLSLLLISHVILTFFITVLVALSIFVGYRSFVSFNAHEAHRITVLSHWSETGSKERSELNKTIKQELDLIIAQRHENQRQRSKIKKLTTQLSFIKQKQTHDKMTRQRRKDRALRYKIETLNTEILRLKNTIVTTLRNTPLPQP